MQTYTNTQIRQWTHASTYSGATHVHAARDKHVPMCLPWGLTHPLHPLCRDRRDLQWVPRLLCLKRPLCVQRQSRSLPHPGRRVRTHTHSRTWMGKYAHGPVEKKKIRSCLPRCTEGNSKWSIDLSVRQKNSKASGRKYRRRCPRCWDRQSFLG